jgi:hypothetical protein
MQGAAKRRILEVFKRAATPPRGSGRALLDRSGRGRCGTLPGFHVRQTGRNPPERRRGDFRHGLLASFPFRLTARSRSASPTRPWHRIPAKPGRSGCAGTPMPDASGRTKKAVARRCRRRSSSPALVSLGSPRPGARRSSARGAAGPPARVELRVALARFGTTIAVARNAERHEDGDCRNSSGRMLISAGALP